MALGKTVEELSASISEAELHEWMAYYAIEPFGEEKADFRNGIVAATIVNVARAMSGSKSGEPAKPTDFMPKSAQESEEDGMDPARIRAGLVSAFGDRIKFAGKKPDDGR